LCGGDREYDYLKALLRSVRKRSNDVFVTVPYKDSEKVQELVTKAGAHLKFWEWNNSFCDARNFADELPKNYRYRFTCDCDDVIENIGNLEKIVWNMEKEGADFAYITYVTGQNKDYGDQIVNVPRMIKLGKGKWVRPIHEVWVGDDPDNFIIDKGKNVRCIHTKKDIESGETRNLNMLLEIKGKTDEDYRYIAASYMTLGQIDKALEYLLKVTPKFGFYFEVLQTIANIYEYRRDLKTGLKYMNKLVKQYGEYSDAYFAKGNYLIKMKKYQEALDTYIEGFKHPILPKIMTFSSHEVFINPLGKVAFLYEELGQHDKAVWCTKVLNKLAPNVSKVKETTKLILESEE
jgi:glycosyltransferase involved in cell wall biosynthesis